MSQVRTSSGSDQQPTSYRPYSGVSDQPPRSYRPYSGGSYRPPSYGAGSRPVSVHSSGQRSYASGVSDHNMSQISTGSHTSTVNLGGVDYPVGARVGKTGLFIIGDPDGPLYTSSTSDLRSSQPSLGSSHRQLVKTTLPYQSRGYSFEYWNWSVIRFVLLILVLIVMVALLAATIGIAVEQSESCGAKFDWWRGALVYHIPVGLFRDTNSDNYGDLKGVSIAISYLENLGVKAVTLSHILQSDIPNWDTVMGYTAVDSRVGFAEDMRDTLSGFHDADISVLLELPLEYTSVAHDWFRQSAESTIGLNQKFENFYIWRNEEEDIGHWEWHTIRNQYYLCKNDSSKPLLNWTTPEVYRELGSNMEFWLGLGVDGFIIKDLEHIQVDSDATVQDMLSHWRQILNEESDEDNKKVLVINGQYLEQVKKRTPSLLSNMLDLVDLVNVSLTSYYNNQNRSHSIAGAVDSQLQQWQSRERGPWVMWSLDNLGKINQDYAAALIMFSLSLPGTPSLTAGQEILQYLLDSKRKTPLLWSDSNEPYLPSFPEGEHLISTLGSIIKARNSEYALRRSLLFKEEEFNYRYLDLKSNLVLMERSYGRSDSFFYTANFGEDTIEKDWSEYAPFGDVLANSVDDEEKNEVQLKKLTMNKGQSLLLRIQT